VGRTRSNKRSTGRRRRVGADELAAGQRDIAVSEFFLKNRHLLGYDAPSKAILTTVKEAVDNALDACEEAGVLPSVLVEIEPRGEGIYRVAVEDNGPGVVDRQIAKIFGKLLYGSRFHRLSQSRGQQGLGIAAAGMYGQLTTGKPMRILTRTSARRPAREIVLSIDTTRNRPRVHRKAGIDWAVKHGTRVEIELEGRYVHGRHSVEEYLRLTSLANPHVRIEYEDPEGQRIVYDRIVRELPPAPRELQPHPHGIELGRLIAMLHETRHRTLATFLQHELSRVGAKAAQEIIERAGPRLRPGSHPHRLAYKAAAALHRALAEAPVSAPDASGVVPIGRPLLLRTLGQEAEAQAHFATTRRPAVYRGNPFVVEAAIAYGRVEDPKGDRPTMLGGADSPATVLRFANRVPLQFAAGGCAITRAITDVNWRSYGLSQPAGSLPLGPMVILVHVASVWVPFTSESKEAIASYPEILHEIRLALQHCGRDLATHIRATARRQREQARIRAVERYLPHVGIALQEILGLSDGRRDRIVADLDAILLDTPLDPLRRHQIARGTKRGQRTPFSSSSPR
jgi:DNA topoisomerase-6 subunit B